MHRINEDPLQCMLRAASGEAPCSIVEGTE